MSESGVRVNPRTPFGSTTAFISAHVILNLLNELRKRDKMQGLPDILSVTSHIICLFHVDLNNIIQLLTNEALDMM